MKMSDIFEEIPKLKFEIKKFLKNMIDKQISIGTYESVMKRKAERILKAYQMKCHFSSYEKELYTIHNCVKYYMMYMRSIEQLECENEYYVIDIYANVKKLIDNENITIIDVIDVDIDIGEKDDETEDY